MGQQPPSRLGGQRARMKVLPLGNHNIRKKKKKDVGQHKKDAHETSSSLCYVIQLNRIPTKFILLLKLCTLLLLYTLADSSSTFVDQILHVELARRIKPTRTEETKHCSK